MNGIMFVGYVLSTEFYCWTGGILLVILLVTGALVISRRMLDQRMESEIQAMKDVEKEAEATQDTPA